MPMAVGPFSRRVCFHFCAMRSKAWSQLTGVKSPSLWYWPSFMRSRAWSAGPART